MKLTKMQVEAIVSQINIKMNEINELERQKIINKYIPSKLYKEIETLYNNLYPLYELLKNKLEVVKYNCYDLRIPNKEGVLNNVKCTDLKKELTGITKFDKSNLWNKVVLSNIDPSCNMEDMIEKIVESCKKK